MSSTATEVLDHEDDSTPADHRRRPWKPWTRIAFRFCFAYFGLLCMLFAQLVLVFTGPLFVLLAADTLGGQLDSIDDVVRTVSTTVFRTEVAPLRKSYSGDQAAIWVLVFCVLVTAVAITAVWSILDRRRPRYDRLYRWFLTAVRLCLGGQMLFYGMAKVIPLQMPRPTLVTLLTPYGDFGPTAVLWNQVGSVPVYEMLLGAAEVVAGLLLFIPRTATAGALLSLVSLLQVFVLNMTFDVPVKLLSFHLVLMCLVVLAPQARRLANILVLERPSAPATQPPLFRGRRANRIAATISAALGLWVLAGGALMAAQGYRQEGGGVPEPPLYGIWTVREFTLDGQPLPPLTTDETRWQRLVFDTRTTAFQKMDGSFVPADAIVDPATSTLTLTGPPHSDSAPPSRLPAYTYTFTFEQPEPDRLTLRGQVDGRPATISLQHLDPTTFPLRSRGFHWIQEYPYTGTLTR
ncbi:DoxX family protein [Nocardia sp. 2]|uniref:DoxX family protein n=1 Tax=Nocardia acididurans TaxID=2802282 RepID=A0ABS1M713_9NOCA|nr:DoxX family protein [Nocardia acididurans]MBL1076415.1 DoxX family protein [Nocardia acididurans]